ncbi:MAG: MBL fold metallo-hydrolase [Rhodospirillales bacterium]|nr:MBL fold metallo-hydrolase [Rhodospirillales bacterium]
MRITILGSGPSSGIPGVTYGWGKCDPNNPKNRRSRPSITVAQDNTEVLIDTSPDLRNQLLDSGKNRFDALLYTHYHADHLNGLDDIRSINQVMNAALDMYCDHETLKQIKTRFAYALEPIAEGANFYYKPTLISHEIKATEEFQLGDLKIKALDQDHGFCQTLGFKFNDTFAYSTDVTSMGDEVLEELKGVKLWIVGVLGDKEHPTHAHVNKALEWAEFVKPEKLILTHLGPSLDYATLNNTTPDHVEAAYDGMQIDI